MELFLAAWSCCFKLYKQMSSFLSIYFKSRNVIQFIVQLLGLYLGFLFLSFLGCSGTSPGGNSATFGTINMACNSCTSLGPFTSKADCSVHFCPVTTPKQIQINPCAIEILVYSCTGFGIEDQNLLCHLLRLTTCKY